MSELGTAIGRPDRAILVITDKGFADKLTEMFEDYEDTEEDS
jgi:ribosomal protein L7Ae-like RNA K-turn-binding protein